MHSKFLPPKHRLQEGKAEIASCRARRLLQEDLCGGRKEENDLLSDSKAPSAQRLRARIQRQCPVLQPALEKVTNAKGRGRQRQRLQRLRLARRRIQSKTAKKESSERTVQTPRTRTLGNQFRNTKITLPQRVRHLTLRQLFLIPHLCRTIGSQVLSPQSGNLLLRSPPQKSVRLTTARIAGRR